MKTVGSLLKDSRERHKLTQQKVSRHLGFSEQFYGRIETGLVPLPLKRAKRAMKFLKIRRNNLINAFLCDQADRLEKALKSRVRKK